MVLRRQVARPRFSPTDRVVCLSETARTIGAFAIRCNFRNPATRDVEAVPGAFHRITEDARLLTSWHPEPVSAILVLRGVGILSLHPTGSIGRDRIRPTRPTAERTDERGV